MNGRTDYQNRIFGGHAEDHTSTTAMSVIICPCAPGCQGRAEAGTAPNALRYVVSLASDYDKPYRKCARIVGDTMGKYHPHGDSSIYETLVVSWRRSLKRECRWWTATATSAPSRETGPQPCVIRRHRLAEVDAGSLSWRIWTKTW